MCIRDRLEGLHVEWHEVFKGVAVDDVPVAVFEEEECERRGLFGRLRRNLGKARAVVADQLKAAMYVGVDRRLYAQVEELLIAADVGVDRTSRWSTSSSSAAPRRRSRRASP